MEELVVKLMAVGEIILTKICPEGRAAYFVSTRRVN
jgi:hypothetical protein